MKNLHFGLRLTAALMLCLVTHIAGAQSTQPGNNFFQGGSTAAPGNQLNAKTIFGVLTIRDNNMDGRLTSANNLGVSYVRETQTLSRWNGVSNTNIDFWLAHKKDIILNINNDTTPSWFPRDLVTYESQLTSFLNVYGSKVKMVVIENEELHDYDSTGATVYYHFGSMKDYINELTRATTVCNQKGIPVTNGGLTVEIVNSLKHYYDVSGKTDSSQWLVQQMQGISSDPGVWMRTDSLLAAYKILPLSCVNLHWYEPAKNLTAYTGVLRVVCNYITFKTGKEVISNETGVKSNDSSFVTPLLRQWDSVKVKYCIVFDGVGNVGARPFTGADNSLLPTGVAFRNYNFGAPASCSTPIVITPQQPVYLCAGSTAKLTASAGYSNYLWNTGAITRSITVSNPGNYFAISNMGACIAFSLNTVVVNVNPLPAKPTITADGPLTNICPSTPVKLTASPFGSFLWNTGDTTKIITAPNTGNYKVTLTDVNGCKKTSDSLSLSYVVCNAPLNLAVTGITSTMATVNWDTVVCAVGYRLQYRLKDSLKWTVIDIKSGGISSKNLLGLMPGLTYQWQICTNSKTNPDTIASAFAQGPEFTMPGTIFCNAPVNLSVTDITNTKATLDWDTAMNSIGYQYQYRIKGTSTWTVVPVTGGGISLKVLYYLTPASTYEWAIRTNCKNTTDSVSAYAPGPDFTTLALPNCNAPINLRVTAITKTNATLGWDTASNAIGYQVQYRAKGAASWIFIPITGAAVSQRNLFGLTVGTTYEWGVRTNCKNTTDSVSVYAAGPDFTTIANPNCYAPLNLRVITITNTSATVNWDTAANSVGYQYEYRIVGTTPWTTGSITGGANAQRTFYSLIPGSTYEWGIRTNCKNTIDSSSPYTAGPLFTTTGTYACNAPLNLNVTGITSTRATLNWDTAANAVGYQYQYRVKGTGTWISAYQTGIGNIHRSLFYLSPGTTYEWSVRTSCRNAADTSSTFRNGPDFTTALSLLRENGSSGEAATITAFSVKVYPNPATDQASIAVTNPGHGLKITLTDLSGKVFWYVEKVTDTNISIPVSSLPKGLYVLLVKNDKNSKMLKFIKE